MRQIQVPEPRRLRRLQAQVKQLGQFVRRQRWSLLLLFIGVLLPLYLFSLLAEEVIDREPFFFDNPLLLALHHRATPALDVFMLWCSRLGNQYGVLPLDLAVFVWLFLRRHLRDAVFFGLAVGGAGLLNQVAKLWFGRARPKLWPSLAPETNASFPSGHAMESMALVLALVILLWPTRWRYPVLSVGLLFVLLVGVSRLYLGVHYPSDILAGWLASLAWVLGSSRLLSTRHDHSVRKASAKGVSPPGKRWADE